MNNDEKVADHTNLIAVVNRIEDNQSDTFTQITWSRN